MFGSEAKYRRLAEVKAVWDPRNLLRALLGRAAGQPGQAALLTPVRVPPHAARP
ncbi:BBE domain-containing protein [Streptomyces aurantiogriseus]|uniref:BBE domain-containing protein n=1 Tax=Streptomyces aurantiogriseus TaxID=66870 RepID=UPI001E29F833|nr:BBE domain-containing protein [Streptomyces aurantiogriseus]